MYFFSALRSQWKKERDSKLSAARHAALANEKEMIESRIRVEDLPSWVFFPDKVSDSIFFIYLSVLRRYNIETFEKDFRVFLENIA